METSIPEALVKEQEQSDQKPGFMVSPFEKSRTIKGIPEITAFTDTHHNTRQLGRLGYEGLASGKRLFMGLSKIEGIRNAVRSIDVLSRVALHVARPFVTERHKEGGVIANLGDTLDAVEAGSVFHSYADIEQYQQNRLKEAGVVRPQVAFIQLDGNHYAFNGPETALDFRPMEKKFGVLNKDSFTQIVGELKKGSSWTQILRDWDNSHRNEHVAVHPLQKWFMEKIYFGSQMGRFVEYSDSGDGEIVSQAAFVNSEISRAMPGFRREDALSSLSEIGIDPNEPLGQEIMALYDSEVAKNQEVIRMVLRDALLGAKTVVYTHNAEGLQPQLVEILKNKPELQQLLKASGKTGREKEFIENNILIYGGHLHLAERDFGVRKKGTISIRGLTRSFVGPIRQRPIPHSIGEAKEALTAKPYTGQFDTPEVLVGNALKPERKQMQGVYETYQRLLEAAQKIVI